MAPFRTLLKLYIFGLWVRIGSDCSLRLALDPGDNLVKNGLKGTCTTVCCTEGEAEEASQNRKIKIKMARLQQMTFFGLPYLKWEEREAVDGK